MSLALTLDPGHGSSLYQQLVDQIATAIYGGRLGPGEQLPSVREVARTTKVNPLTVAKAYAELEQRALVTTQWGKGTFVAANRPAARDVDGHLDACIDRFLVDALPLVDDPKELLERITRRMRSRKA